MKPSPSLSNGQPAPYKEVRFSQAGAPIRRTRSVSTSNPYTASRATRRPEVTTHPEFAVYVEQSRSLLERQRLNFERERAAFVEERKLWDMERALLKSRIAELESRKENTNRSNGTSSKPHFLTDFTFQGISHRDFSQRNGASNSHGHNSHHVWEGTSPSSVRPTRVFPDETMKNNLSVPPIDENGFGLPPSLDAALSPQSRAVDRLEAIPVPIEKVDSELDGITLKSTALPPEVVAKVISPSTSANSSTPKSEPDKPTTEGRSPLKLKLSDLGPPETLLTRDAGHTPMAMLGTETEASYQSPVEDSPEENPLAPTTTKQPVENSDSYFPDVEDDPSLKGPLSLRNNAEADMGFLSELDQKLLDEARRAVAGPSKPDGGDNDNDNDNNENDDQSEPDPGLKFKNSTNFGTAFGASGGV
jgi:hypothetical protein